MMSQKITLICAISENNCIGADNRMLWHFPEDFRFFKQNTLHKPIIMGRNTWLSLPKKPLPERHNIVISRTLKTLEGAEVAGSLQQAITLAGDVPEVMIIGGGQIYAEAMPIATDLYLTHIPIHVEGDTFFPPILATQWQVVSEQIQDTKQGIPLTFRHYQRYQ